MFGFGGSVRDVAATEPEPSLHEYRDTDRLRLIWREDGTVAVWTPYGMPADELGDILADFAKHFRDGSAHRVQ